MDNTAGVGLNGLKFYNNTIVNVTGGSDSGVHILGGTTSRNWDVQNNLWYASDPAALTTTSGSAHDYNTLLDTAYANGIAGNPHDSQTTQGSGDPFGSSAAGDLHLSSPLIDAHLNDGVLMTSPYNLDFDGEVRGTAGAWDRGAYEYSGGRTAGSSLYIAQALSGTADGSSCVNAKAVGFFNNAVNWGTGAGQIGPGTTVHLCGTFTGTAGSTMLTFQGSGDRKSTRLNSSQ